MAGDLSPQTTSPGSPTPPAARAADAVRESWQGARVYTIGHSTRTLEALVSLLRAAGVTLLADVRSIPRSRRHPHFDGDALGAALPSHSIRYVHLAGLGGLRRARPDSANTGWRHPGFRGFADHMQTDAFESALEALRGLVATDCVALMCAEAVPWRCHRSLVADALTARGARVEHIVGSPRPSLHRLTPFAKVEDGRVTYPGDEAAGGSAPG
jgi:uncharacterized protein (DUF488 family)